MEFPIGSQAKIKFEKLKAAVSKIALLVLEVNARTVHSGFMDIAGHVGVLEVEVGKDKEDDYNTKLFEEELEYQYDPETSESGEYEEEDELVFYVRANEKAEYIITRLEKFLNVPPVTPERPVKLW